MESNLWRWYLAAVVVVGQYYFVSAVSATPDATLYTGLGISSVVAVIAGLVLHRPASWALRAGWLLVAAGVATFLIGDAVYASLSDDGAFVTFPSTADWWYLAMYPILGLGVVLLRRGLVPGGEALGAIDALVVGLVTAAVLGVLYMNSHLDDPFLDQQMRLVAVAYPVGDALLVALAAWLLAGRGVRSPALSFVAAGVGFLVLGNAVYNVQTIDGSYQVAGPAEAAWLAFTVFIAVAALHPAMGRPVQRTESGRLGLPWHRALLPLVMLVVPATSLVRGADGHAATWLLLATALGLLAAGQLVAAHRARPVSSLPQSMPAARDATSEAVVEGTVSVLFVDLQHLGGLEVRLGPNATDAARAIVADRLRERVRPDDMVIRVSTDQFAVLLNGGLARPAAQRIVRRLEGAFAMPVEIDGRFVVVSAHVGVAVAEPAATSDAEIERPGGRVPALSG